MKYKLGELIDTKRLQEVLDNLYAATGIPSGIVGTDGEIITATGWRDICTKFHRVNDITETRCVESDMAIKNKISAGERYVISKCKNGMVDIGAPIRVNGEHIATMFQGQFFFEEPDWNFFKKQAKDVGFDEESYIEAIKATPIITENEIRPTVMFLTGFAEFIADIGYSNLQATEAYKELKESHEETTGLYEELLATEEDLREHYELLTYRKQELEMSEERYQLVSDGSNDVIWDVNLKNGEVFCSAQFKDLFGYPSNYVTRRFDYLKLIHPEDLGRMSDYFEHTLEHKTDYKDEYRCIHADGHTVWISSKGKVLRNREGKATRIAGSFRDITETINYQRHIEQMAYQDSLTGIANRNQCLRTLNTLLESKEDTPPIVSVLFLDLDNFKNINDVYGHQIGDAVLISVAKRLKNLRLPGMTLSRFGGDEFVILFETTDTNLLKDYAKEMLDVLESPFSIHQKIFHISASIGVACYPSGGKSAETLLKNADMSMYIAKQNGKNNFVCFREEMDTENKRKREIEESLNRAIDDNEFFIVYQPKVHVEDNKLLGVEALIRWNDPKQGIISPMEFIPVAEERGLIKKIDKWVINRVIQQKKEWEMSGYEFGIISINISPNFLMDSESIPYLKTLIEKQSVNPKRLQFEITENVLIKSYRKANATILALKELGFSIALDDFGKGYSSLSYLKRLPVDDLKIDKLFIDEMLHNEQPIIDFIIGMGQRLNMNVIAEGVETKEQLDTLKHYGCDMYQGYFFSKPLTKEDIIQYF
jgi:diguanylate cyclase (GGDEF)-like protein/PAS domain S-box-containing protein